MILQALYQLHDRLSHDPDYHLAAEGYSLQKISFVIVLNPDGSLHDIQDHRIQEGKLKRPQTHQVMGGAKSSGSGFNPCMLWDNSSYLLGVKPDDDNPQRTQQCFEHSRAFHLGFQDEIRHTSYDAVCRFFQNWQSARAGGLPALADLSSGFGIFQIRGDTRFLHESPEIADWWQRRTSHVEAVSNESMCLLTGERAPIAVLHQPKIKNVKDAQGAGALIVSFNASAFESYGKKDGSNAPVSEAAAAKYCKALNALLASKRHRIQIGDATTVFWTELPTKMEECLSAWLSGEAGNESTQDRERLTELEGALRSIQKGARPVDVLRDEARTPFYVLGLTGQAGGRIGIRFWHQCTLGEFFAKLASHHAHLAIERQWGDGSRHPDPEFPRLMQLLRQTARDAKDIPPTLGGALMRSILSGGPYPEMLAVAVINRIRADRTISYLRAAILKAWLTRIPNTKHGVVMSLNEDDKNVAYRLGRLFAALEKTQEDALGNVNASIRDRFYSSASATPASVFPRVMRTYQHHLAKLHGGLKVTREKLIQDILDPVADFPSFLNLQDQGRFVIGYYHQRKRLFTKTEATAANP